ncbi:MAG: cyclic nucleotide-binding domain-containing protein, partial [Deltaproteobacteria bacterium]|nr:cyclic nucleotide-binding domain-containing protein [Deltaproteobacteria bacterium]
HEGQLLAAMIVVLHGLEHARNDQGLLQVLERIHVRGMRAKAGNLAMPPPLRPTNNTNVMACANAAELLSLGLAERLTKAGEIGCSLPPAAPGAAPVALPLFCELDTQVFTAVVRSLSYHRVPAGADLLKEGDMGDSLLILASGMASVSKNGAVLAKLGPGSVVGEMALITRAPRSATVTADEFCEYFELSRQNVHNIAKLEPKVADELQAYCRGRLLQNLLRSSPLFARFDEQTRIDILSRFKTITFEAAEGIIVQGQLSPGLYLIASGEVDVKIANSDGEMVHVATLKPGEVFGEISLIKKQPATAYVTARNTVGALVLTADEFEFVLQEHPGVREYLVTLTADRLQASREALDASGFIDDDDLILL